MSRVKVLFIFIDGVGLRPPAADNPVRPGNCPTLCGLIEEHARPIDACLEMPGLPQSATGQTAIYTGVNASRHMGRHCEGFPGPTLRKLIEEDNIFKMLARLGLRCRFADAFSVDSIEELTKRRFKSVTTVMSLSQPETISTLEDLLEDQAVFHDITRATLQEKGQAIEPIAPQQAGEHLVQLALTYDFTLFEFFLTDLAGHSRNPDQAAAVLQTLDIFLETVVKLCATTGLLLVLTSDHGNIEDLGTRGHTRNLVPFVALGPGGARLTASVNTIMDITPALVGLMAAKMESDF